MWNSHCQFTSDLNGTIFPRIRKLNVRKENKMMAPLRLLECDRQRFDRLKLFKYFLMCAGEPWRSSLHLLMYERKTQKRIHCTSISLLSRLYYGYENMMMKDEFL